MLERLRGKVNERASDLCALGFSLVTGYIALCVWIACKGFCAMCNGEGGDHD